MAPVNGSTPATNGNGSVANGNGVVPKKPAVDVSVALAPNDLKSVSGLVESISALGSSASSGDEQARLELVEKARRLVRALETPRETMIKHCWAQVRELSCLFFFTPSHLRRRDC